MIKGIKMRGPQDKEFLVGKTLGKYHIVDILGVGGMGVVYRAVHSYLHKEVAIKLISPQMDESDIPRFQREAKVLAELRHPNIVEIYDFDITEWGQPYYVMELLYGRSLKEEIKAYKEGLPLELFCLYMTQIASALSYAHSRGIVHRDIKPSNIFIAEIGGNKIVKVLDFGLAKHFEPERENLSLTTTSRLLGTPYYMAPEQILGKEVGPYTDIYSLALIGAEMLLGKPARAGKSWGEIITSGIKEPLNLKGEGKIPARIIRAFAKATQPEVEKRYQTAMEFLNDMCPHASTIKETPISFPHSGPKARKVLSWTLLPLIAALILGVFLFKSPRKQRMGFSPTNFNLPVPPSSKRILTQTEKGLVLMDSQSLVLRPFSPKTPPWKLPLREGERVLREKADGNIYTFYRGKVLLHDLQEGTSLPVVEGLEGGKSLKISWSAKYAAVLNKDLVVYSIEKGKPTVLFRVKIPETPPVFAYEISENCLAVLIGREFRVYSLKTSSLMLTEKMEELIGRPVIAINDREKTVALSGWTDKTFIFDLEKGEKTVFSSPGRTYHMLFLPRSGFLLLAKEGRLILWKGKSTEEYQNPSSDFKDLYFSSRGIVALDSGNTKLSFFSYREFPYKIKEKISAKEIWALEGRGDEIFIGGREGVLYKYRWTKGRKDKIFAHNNGITYIGIKDKYLLTASDDRTIGVFMLPEAKLIMRSKAHAYLINYLFFPRESSAFWSSSSDGTLKKWTLPYLEDKESIKIKGFNFAAFWKDSKTLLAGTWNKSIVLLERGERGWKLSRKFPVESQALYQMVYLPQKEMVVGIGIYPSVLYIYDLKNKELYQLEVHSTNYIWAVPFSQDSILAMGRNTLGKYKFERTPGGIKYTESLTFNTDLGDVFVGKILGSQLALGTASGELFLINTKQLKFYGKTQGKLEKIH